MDLREILARPSQGEVRVPTEEPGGRQNPWGKKRRNRVADVASDPATKRQKPSSASVSITPSSSEPNIPNEPLEATAIKQLVRQQLWSDDKKLPTLGLALALVPMPPVRTVQLTGKGKFSLRRANNLVAALIQATGILAEKPCDGCKRGSGLFAGCVIPREPEHQSLVYGVCANHYYNSNGLLCTFCTSRPAEEYLADPVLKAIEQFLFPLLSDRLDQLKLRKLPRYGYQHMSDRLDELFIALEQERKWRVPDRRRWAELVGMPHDDDGTAEVEIDEANDNGSSGTPTLQPVEGDKLQSTSGSKLYDYVQILEETVQDSGEELRRLEEESRERIRSLEEKLQRSKEALQMLKSAIKDDI
ncbi:hypothetical protein EV127DRAFT_420833 [Xylaria flabelliformis]|nr:hypothetical protein EV127DRAFT_420833 [Xylaria flabelliformis]